MRIVKLRKKTFDVHRNGKRLNSSMGENSYAVLCTIILISGKVIIITNFLVYKTGIRSKFCIKLDRQHSSLPTNCVAI